MSRVGILILLALLGVGGLIAWGHTHELFYPTGLGQVLDVFWGKLLTADFVASLVLIGVWIGLLHPPGKRLSRGLAWTIFVVVLGTPAALLFFLLRARRFKSAQDVFLRWDSGETQGAR